MHKKYFIDDGTKTFSMIANHKPGNPDYIKVALIPDALLSEDDRWLQFELIDIDGVMTDVVTVDDPLKTTIQQQDLDNQLAKDAADAIKQTEIDLIKSKADKDKLRKIDSLTEIKAEIQNIYDILDALVNNKI